MSTEGDTNVAQSINQLMDELWKSQSGDIKIISKNKPLLNVHKFVIMKRSNVYKEMFSSEFKEKNTSEISYFDYHEDVIKIFFKYLYTDDMNIIFENNYEEKIIQ